MISAPSLVRLIMRAAGVSVVSLMVCLSTGCNEHYDSSLQIQVYGPSGSDFTLREASNGGSIVHSRGPMGDRLEHAIEDCAVYDLSPGRYEFAYQGAVGAQAATIYGELDVLNPSSGISRKFIAHTFIPIRLPSGELQEAEHLFPSRDLSYTEGLEMRHFEHLKQGDLVEMVYFVADLSRVKEDHDIGYFQAINDIDRELDVLAEREEYLNRRYSNARRKAMFRDPNSNVGDQIAHENFDLWGIEEPYVVLARKIKGIERERESLIIARREFEDERDRRNALLRSMRVVHRAGALVLASPDLSLPFADAVAQAETLGDVVAVVRVGGRHQYWAMGGGDEMMNDTMRGEP
jgi:hypothetical protein